MATLALIAVLWLAGADSPTILVHLADGSRLPLSSWSFSYEYVTWPQGADPAYGQVARRQASTLWLGRRQIALEGAALELQPEAAPRERLALVQGEGRRERLKAEPPGREVVAPQVGKDQIVVVRSLDLLGQTLAGTRRQFCLASFSVLVECGGTPEQRVVRVEFPRKE
jgi:hypothetical protein